MSQTRLSVGGGRWTMTAMTTIERVTKKKFCCGYGRGRGCGCVDGHDRLHHLNLPLPTFTLSSTGA